MLATHVKRNFENGQQSIAEALTDLPDQSIAKTQQRKYQEGKAKKKIWVRLFGDKEEPLPIVDDQESEQFNRDRDPSSVGRAMSATFLGACGLVRQIVTGGYVGPSDEQLCNWIAYSTISEFISDGELQLAPYQKMPTLLPGQMKSFGTRLYVTQGKDKRLQLRKIKVVILDNSTIQYTVRPLDLAWASAKLMLMHNINHQLVLHRHPNLHVLATSLCCLTRLHLAEKHPIRRLLDAHFQYTLAITDKVLNDTHSILLQHTSEFSPFDISIDTMHTFHIQAAHKQLCLRLDNPYLALIKADIPYGFVMDDYRRVISQWIDMFCDKHLDSEAYKDPSVGKWWNAIRKHFGPKHLFPWKSTKFLSPRLLRDILVTIIFDVSIKHSTDHLMYADIPPNHKPWSWYGDLPQHSQDLNGGDPEIPVYERFQAEAANHMFFTTNPAVKLENVTYIDCPMNNAFLKDELQRLYLKYRLFSPEKISTSIDW